MYMFLDGTFESIFCRPMERMFISVVFPSKGEEQHLLWNALMLSNEAQEGTVFKVCKKIQYELPRTVLDFIDRQQLMSIVGMIKWFLKNPGGVSSGKRNGYWRTDVHFNKCDHGPDNDLFLFKCKLC